MFENASCPFALLLRRQWWLIALTVVAAVLVGVVIAALGTATTYTGSATVAIDTATVSRVSGLPLPETLLKALTSADFRSVVANDAGVSAATVAGGLNVYTTGSPQDRLFVEFKSTDKATAQRIAGVARTSAIAYERKLAEPILGKNDLLLAANRDALAQISVLKPVTDWERSDVRYKIWSLKRQIALDDAECALERDVYSPLGGVSVAEDSKTRAMAVDAVGAALIGLALGLALAWARDRAAAKA